MRRHRTGTAQANADHEIFFHEEHGPFDLIGDVHGCGDELRHLLTQLGWDLGRLGHPEDRRIIIVGDLVDRGPDIVGVLRLAMQLTARDLARCVLGNHEWKLLRKLQGRNVQIGNGLQQSLDQLNQESGQFRAEVLAYLESMPLQLHLDDGQLVVAHAGINERLMGKRDEAARSFALFGDTTGKTDADGYPERRDWAQHYAGSPLVVYGHSPVPEAVFVNSTINLDTGCVFGGALTALRYPERQLVAVPAAAAYFDRGRSMDA